MRELTGKCKVRRTMLCADRPEQWEELDLHGLRVMYNTDNLRSVLLDSGEEFPIMETSAKPQFNLTRVGNAKFIVLNVAHSCNLKCRYCLAAEYPSTPVMTIPLAREAINKLFDLRSDIRISFFGGEPLMAWDTIKATMEYAKSIASARKVRCIFHITTNGTLLTEDMVKVIKAYNCSILISIDGPEHIHNAWRPMKNGMNSFEATMNAIHLMKKHGLGRRLMLRSTFTPECTHLVERLEFAYDLQCKGLCGGCSVEPASVTEGCIQRDSMPIQFPDSLEKEYHDAAVWFVDLLNDNKPIPTFFHFKKMLHRLYYRQASATECGAGRGYLTISPDGSIYACHRESGAKIGHIRLGIDEQLRYPWMDNRIYRSPTCMKCNPVGTPILMADLSWKPIEKVQLGDRVMAFNALRLKKNQHRMYEIATVLATTQREAPLVRVTTERGSFQCTPDHRWYTGRTNKPYETARSNMILHFISSPVYADENADYKHGWLQGMSYGDGTFTFGTRVRGGNKTERNQYRLALTDIEGIRVFKQYCADFGIEMHDFIFRQAEGNYHTVYGLRTDRRDSVKFLHTLPTGTATKEYMRGFLAGFYDAEGSICNMTVTITQAFGKAAGFAIDCFRALGYAPCIDERMFGSDTMRKKMLQISLTNTADTIRFFSEVHPKISRKYPTLSGTAIRGNARVLSVEALNGIHPVHGLQTTTGNYIAHGYLSKNCWARFACGGGCRQVLAEKGKPLTSVEPEHCRVMQILIRECIWILATMTSAAKERYFNDSSGQCKRK